MRFGSTYRKLAKELHPDLNPGNQRHDEERFKKVAAANDIIGDPEKRKQFDRGEIDASGEARRRNITATLAGGGPVGPLRQQRPARTTSVFRHFGDLFGDAAAVGAAAVDRVSGRGRMSRYTLEVDFLEAAAGAKKRVTLPDGGGARPARCRKA